MSEHEALVRNYSHLRDFPRAAEALHTLRRIASVVKPIMRARRWKLGELAEFYPDQANLLGLNVNAGQRILLRLRFASDRTLFLPIEQVVDTMLHELSHNVHGPHNNDFHALWNQLRNEHMSLAMKGYTGEGFLGAGQRLGGGGRMPMHEARRLARAAAEQRQQQQQQTSRHGRGVGGGRRLGGGGSAGTGTGTGTGHDVRRVIADAAEQRKTTLRGCGNQRHNNQEIQNMSDAATRNGFRTQAEEDAANDAAIAQALWELVQEEEMAKYGSEYIPPSAENPMGNGGGAVRRPGEVPHSQSEPVLSHTTDESGWACGVCTLHNTPGYLCCGACGSERPGMGTTAGPSAVHVQSPSTPQGPAKRTTTRTAIDLTDDSPPATRQSRTRTVAPQPSGPPPLAINTWACSFCGFEMDRQWWMCSVCQTVKTASK